MIKTQEEVSNMVAEMNEISDDFFRRLGSFEQKYSCDVISTNLMAHDHSHAFRITKDLMKPFMILPKD